MSRRLRWLRWLARGVALGAALPVVIVLGVLLALRTDAGRARALEALLPRIDERIPGHLEIGALDRIGLGGVALRDVRLLDPDGRLVLELAALSAELQPLELLDGRVVLSRVALARARVDLTDIGEPGRGLLGALIDPTAPPAPPSPGPPPYVRVEEIAVSDVEVQGPALAPPWRALQVKGIQASARFELDGAPEVRLTSFACDVLRAERPLARVESLEALLARPGAPSELSLALAVAGARASARLRGVLPPAAEHSTQPISGELHVEGLTAARLAELLESAELAGAFAGPIAVDVNASGTLDQLGVSAQLGTAAGTAALSATVRGRRELALGLTTSGLVLAQLRPELPRLPLSLSLTASLDQGDPARLPLVLRVLPGQLGPFALPSLDARGTYTGEGVRDLAIDLRQGASRVNLRGSADLAGAIDVHVGAAVNPAELRALARAAGLAAQPRASLSADARLQRSSRGELTIRGAARAEGVHLPELALDFARVEVDLAGAPLALEGNADLSVRGLTRGALRVPRADLVLVAARGQYRARGSVDVDRSRVELDLGARPVADHWLLDGKARGHWERTPFALRLARTAISPEGWFETSGIDIDIDSGVQALHVKGGVGRPRSELVVSAPALELGQLARLAGLGDDWRGQASLYLRQRGGLETPALHLTLDARDVARRDAPSLSLRLDARLDAEQGRASLDAATGSGPGTAWLDGALAVASEFRGGVGWTKNLTAARQSVILELRRLDLSSLEAWLGRKLPLSAQIALSASLAGTLRQPVLDARLHAALAPSLGLPPLKVEQHVTYAGGELAASLEVDDMSGRWLDLGAALTLTPADADDLLALPARARALGDASRWSVKLGIQRRRVGAAWADAPAAAAGLELDARLELAHEPGVEPSGNASVHVSEARLPTSPAGCAEAGAELALSAALADGELDAGLTVTHRRTRLLESTASARLELSPALRGGPMVLGKIASALQSRGLDLERVPYLCGRVRGRLDAEATLDDPLGPAPRLDARLAASDLSLGAEPSLDVELTARADRSQASADLRLRGPRGTSRISGRVPVQWSSGRLAVAADAPLTASARLVALPIAPLLDPAGAVSYASGWLSGSVDVGGSVAAPDPSGTLELRDAELTATALAQPLSGVHGRVTFDRRALGIERFEARDRDGRLSVSGRVERRGSDALDVKLDVNAARFPLRQRGQVVATTSGHAKIQAGIEPGRTSVAVQLLDADTWLERAEARTGIDLAAHPDFVVTGGAPAAGRAVARAAEPPQEAADPERESHVRLDASDRFWIKRDDFAIQLSTTLDAVIAGDRAKVTGKVDINRGYLDMFGRVFEVSRGSRLEFIGSNRPDPVVDISATHEHRGSGQTVRVQISGQGSKPVLTFFIDDTEASAGTVLELLLGRRGSGGDASAKAEATSFVSALTAGLLATSARRELGAAAPIIMIEPGEQTGDGRIRAGFELDSLVPDGLRRLITGVYVEGIVEREGSSDSRNQSQQPSTQAGVLLELYFPHQLFSTGQWGPGTTWSIDWGWQL